MTGRLEQNLAQTLDAAAGSAPGPGVDFLDNVRRRQRGLRNRRRATVAAVLAAACLAGTLAAVGHFAPFAGSTPTDRKPARPATSPSPLTSRFPIVRLIQPANLFWPSAVHTLPATLPDGSSYQVAAVLGADRYLVAFLPHGTDPGRGADPLPYATGVGVFDTGAHRVTTLATLPPTTDAQVQLGLPRNRLLYLPLVDGDRVAWADTVVDNGSPYTEVWAASTGTGTAVRLTRIPGVPKDQRTQVGPPRPVGDTVVWERYASSGDQSTTTGTYRAPAAGGTPALVPGTAGYGLVTGAWAQPDGTQVSGHTDQLWNVLTGQRMQVPAGGVGHTRRLECSPTWCAGAGAETISSAVVAADGSGGPTELDRPYRLADGGGVALAAGSDSHGRPQGVVVWNPATGVWGGLAAPYQLPADPVDADLAVLQSQSGPGAPIEVFDLTVAGRPA